MNLTCEMKIGSLFDGSGTAPLAARMLGMEPVWASEIEPFPIAVTKKNFPNMMHLGSITEMDGGVIEPVDIIVGGSPCQDLSVAGKQRGIIDGARSSLFFEQIRIIKEMRDHDRKQGRTGKDIRCRWCIWENVPGAFSSNRGADYREVIQAFVNLALNGEEEFLIPQPEKWPTAGLIVDERKRFSIGYRTLDAQYWGVPQRRRRIYLVADLGSDSAGKVLFEQEGLSRDYQSCGAAWERIAAHAQGSPDGSDRT